MWEPDLKHFMQFDISELRQILLFSLGLGFTYLLWKKIVKFDDISKCQIYCWLSCCKDFFWDNFRDWSWSTMLTIIYLPNKMRVRLWMKICLHSLRFLISFWHWMDSSNGHNWNLDFFAIKSRQSCFGMRNLITLFFMYKTFFKFTKTRMLPKSSNKISI